MYLTLNILLKEHKYNVGKYSYIKIITYKRGLGYKDTKSK